MKIRTGMLEEQCLKYEKAGYLLKEDTERILLTQRKRVERVFPGKDSPVLTRQGRNRGNQ